MMDKRTFDRFQGFAVAGEKNNTSSLNHLTVEEAGLYELLKSRQNNNRLEQEKIPQDYVVATFLQLRSGD